MPRADYRQRNKDRLRAYDAAYREANREKRRQWDREHDERNRDTCERCGGPRGGGTGRPSVPSGLCGRCVGERAEERKRTVVALYESEAPYKEIAAALGVSVGMVSVELNRLRAAGRIGYRYKAYESSRDQSRHVN